MEDFSPAVSVIVPVYNAEKYLGVCLESILIQTFTDFEVIVVDDCSTDRSLTIAENFLERFNGRLKIISLEENTGSCAIPRNVGLNFARGKYILFVDNDDLIIDTALAEFFNAAETFQADVVYTEAFFTCGAEIIPKQLNEEPWDFELTVDAPTFDSADFGERVKKFIDFQVRWVPWTKFVRRDLLVNNEIKFPAVRICEDGFWTFKLLCLAKRWLRVPNSLYIYRCYEEQTSAPKRSPQDELKFWLNPLTNGVEQLYEFMSRFDFFAKHPNYGVRVINSLANECFKHMIAPFQKLSPREIYEIFLQEFSAGGRNPALEAYLLFIANTYRNELMRCSKKNRPPCP